MKKIFLSLFFLGTFARAFADEGMWLPMLLGQQVYNDMVKRGLKLSKEQLYSINKPSIKDAIIIFGRGCTGEIVSNEGLIFTNHHCGYDAIAKASSVKNNYLRDGFYAFNKGQELQTELTVQFLERIEDVTPEVMNAVKGLAWADRQKKLQEVYKTITDRVANKDEGLRGQVYSMFKDNQYLLYVYKTYTDIRLVGTPPESVGKFGGDSDNWEWPRHTGDFAIFRVYASKTGKPAAYSTENVPLKPKHFLPVSLKGVENGSFAMIYGYPGGTNRYETSYGIKLKNEIENPYLVKLRDMRLKAMHEQMVKDPAVKLKLASDYAGIANYWKFFDGETKQLEKYKIYDQKLKYEDDFTKWAQGKDEYKNLMKDHADMYSAWTPYAKSRQYLREGIMGSTLASFASSLMNVERVIKEKGADSDEAKKAIESADRARANYLESADLPSDKKIMATTALWYYTDVDSTQRPKEFYTTFAGKYGSPTDAGSYNKWADDVFKNTMILNNDSWNAFKANPTADALANDPAYSYASQFVNFYSADILPKYNVFVDRNRELGMHYMKGIREMNPGAAAKMYPDANFSMRVSYGSVKNYSPRDAVTYDFVTTSRGILEKYVPGDYEFDLPSNQIELLKKRDFGQYIDKKRNDLVIGFITTNDITGGNSGSPVIDGSGNLIGLAFDGNYEALSHKIAFDKDLNRTINVDIRYVLWCIDKLGSAKNIINELKLVR